MYYELVFETGAHSVAQYDSEEEMLDAVKAHHERATMGEDGGPAGQTAERVVKVLAYEQHPNDGFANQSADTLKKEIESTLKDLTQDGVVDVMELSQAVRELANPTVTGPGRHDSLFKAKEAKAFEQKEWVA